MLQKLAIEHNGEQDSRIATIFPLSGPLPWSLPWPWLYVLLLVLVTPAARGLDPQRGLDHYGHQVWHSDSGLPQNTVHTLLQSREGYLWLGTDGGLVRFDGVDFVTFNTENTPQLKSDLIYDLLQDEAGNLWISTAAGLVRYRDGGFTEISRGLPAETVWFTYEDRRHRLWAITAAGPAWLQGDRFVVVAGAAAAGPLNRQGLAESAQGRLWLGGSAGVFAVDSQVGEPQVVEHLLSGSQAGAVVLDAQETLWVATGEGLVRVQGNKPATVALGPALDKAEVTALAREGPSGLWVGTARGLIHLGEGGVLRLPGSEQPTGRIDRLFRDRRGVLWVAAEHGLFRLMDNQLKSTPALANDRVLALYEDREGDVWLGTDASGLHLLRDQKFTTYTTSDGLSGNLVRCVLQSADGDLWIGTDGAGLNRRLHKESGGFAGGFLHYTVAQGLSSNVILSLAGGAHGDLWIGTPDGLNLLHAGPAGAAGKIEKFTSADGLPDDFIRSLYTDADGSLWVGTRHGLAHRVGEQFTSYSALDGLGSDFIGAIWRQRGTSKPTDGTTNLAATNLAATNLAATDLAATDLWIGTAGGLSRMHGESFTNYTVTQGLSDNVVTAIAQSAAGEAALWLGTNRGGLNRLQLSAATTAKQAALQRYPFGAQTLPETIYGLLDDGRGDLWLSAKTGIFRVPLAQLNAYAAGQTQALDVTAYDTADGMTIREGSGGGHPAAWKLNDGSLWFATLDGVSSVDPGRAIENRVPPAVVIEKVLVNDRVSDRANQGEAPSGELTLPPGANRLEFQYAGISFAAPQKVRYRYQLEGFDHGWMQAGSRRSAFYTNLPPGPYRFRVLAANSDGVWNTSGASFVLHLKPHFYQTWWWKAALVLLFGLLGYLVYRWRVLQVEAQFGAVLAERGRLAREIHDTLAQGFVGVSVQLELVARLLSPLHRPAKQPAESEPATGVTPSVLTPVVDQLDQARALVRASLDDARASIWNLRGQGGSPQQPASDLPARLSQHCSRLTRGSATKVYLQVKGTYRPVERRMEDELLRIGQEAVANALHHAEATRIDVQLVYEAQRVSLEIRDDGRGFTLSAPPGEPLTGPPGHYGIRGMQERAREIDAQLLLESTPGAGTRVWVEAPLG